ncbi:phage antirepressor protein [Streptomyces sp. F001]|uniref:phage antirepressor n=1 Tax=Streptomyces sp. F001 TaxID=1510026 RepID=UPI00101E3AB5|nr:phage antirepressor KilAC domain-containing protein [Streptomyces sp. F001]RZB18390.1 phage antirepressor protein [Streptomyces sp. F001]
MLSIPDEPQPAVHTFPDTGHSVRSVIRDGEPWWVAADVCAVLGYSRVADALRIPDADDLGTHFVRGHDGRERPAQIINEPGLYSLILRSHRPEAHAFKRWVTHEVLPEIRRTGRYAVARQEPTKLELARDLVAALEAQEAAEQRAAELEPSAAAWDTLAAEAVGDYSVREAAQLLSRDGCIRIGQNRLFAKLRELRWIDAHGEPYQREVDAGRLVRRTTSWTHPRTGEPRLSWQVRVTPKGLAALRDRLGCPRSLLPAAPAA